MGRLEDKVAIVTGSTSGIGRATAICLAGEGAKVVVTGRNEQRGRITVDTIHQAGGEAIFVQQEVTEEGDWQTLFARTAEAFGGTDILINNAGDCILKPIEYIDTELFRFHLRVNIEACFLGMKYAMPEMWKRGGGAIVNISSVAGLKGGVGGTAYGASKGGMTAMTRTAALEGTRNGATVRVNTLHPGFIWGEGVVESMGDEGAAKFRETMVGRTPLKRVGEPDDIAQMVLFLASDDAAHVNGADIVVDGGYMAV